MRRKPQRLVQDPYYFWFALCCCGLLLFSSTTTSEGEPFAASGSRSRASVLLHNNGYSVVRYSSAEERVRRHLERVFGSNSTTKNSPQKQQTKAQPDRRRSLEEQLYDDDAYYKQKMYGNNYYNDDAAANDDAANNDDAAAKDDYYAGDDDAQYDDRYANMDDANGDDAIDDIVAGDNEVCAQFLVSFLEGTTDARDTCEGIMNAYTAAECAGLDYSENHYDFDDYFEEFTEHQCCQALQTHHSDYCEEDSLLSNFHLFLAASVLLMCECAKAVVTRLDWHFLPEAAVCILVGTMVGLGAHFLPSTSIDDLSFDDELFLQLLLPPIIFEAALSVSKREFKRRRGAIFMFSVFGTIISTFSTGLMVHYASKVSSATTFPMLDSLVFGALISSIDPVAILSVLTSLNLDQKDTIFILVFGESLLNDGIAITVFQTLVDRFDGKTNDGTTSLDEILDAIATFLIAMFGSISVGLACGCGAWVYFSLLGQQLPPVMEVGSFFLWALIPYYICDGVGWSGIVAIVAVAFFMDIYIAGPKQSGAHDVDMRSTNSDRTPNPSTTAIGSDPQQHHENQQHEHQLYPRFPPGYREMMEDDDFSPQDSLSSIPTARSINPLPSTNRIHLSNTADKHVRFVAHLTSQLAENAIFAYLGLFLFSNNYNWNPTLISIAIFSCVMSRLLMVVVVSYLLIQIYKCRGKANKMGINSSRTAAAIRDRRTQAVVVLAGLRGAVSLALVENVPIYNNVTGEGCEFKQVMKGMASACILFTTFVFGGGAYYVLPHLGIARDSHPPELIGKSGTSA